MIVSNPQKVQTRFFDDIYKPRIVKLKVPYDGLNHGRKVLIDEVECDRYIGLYGGHHFHKLYAVFSLSKFQDMEGRSVEIIDWGCGQAIATCILLDYFIQEGLNASIEAITLIEPSSIAQERGDSFIRLMLHPYFSSSTIIQKVYKYIDDLHSSDIKSSPNNIKIHLFSNIIDVETFDLNKLYQLIINCFEGDNHIICTSPYRNETNYRIDSFYNLFYNFPQVQYSFHTSKAIFKEVFYVASGKFEIREIKRYERQFTIKL